METTNFEVPFSLTAPTAAWVLSQEVEDGVVLFSGGPGRWLVFTTAGQPDIEGWVEFLTTDPKLIATEPVDAQIGSATGVTVDVRTSAEAIDGAACRVGVPCVQLFLFAPSPESLFGWVVEEGLVDRVWLVDEEGETVAIFAEATDEGFDTWIVEVEEALATLEWA